MTDEEREAVREATDIANLVGQDVELRRRGNRLWGLCPFHEDHDPSLVVDPHRGTYHCFACQAHGDVFEYVMRTRDATFPEAAEMLARRAGIELGGDAGKGGRLPRARLAEIMEVACEETRRRLAASPKVLAWLGSHGIDEDAAMRWDLGHAPGGNALCNVLRQKGYADEEVRLAGLRQRGGDGIYRAVTIPVRDVAGTPVGLAGHTLTSRPITVVAGGASLQPAPMGTGRSAKDAPFVRNALVGLEHARDAIGHTGVAVVTTDPLEAIVLHERGLDNAVSCAGGGLSTRQANRLVSAGAHAITIVIPDGVAGERAATATLPAVTRTNALVACMTVTGSDTLAVLASSDVDAMRQDIAQAPELVSFALDRIAHHRDLTDPQELVDAVDEACHTLTTAANGDFLTSELLAQAIARRFDVCDPSLLRDALLGRVPGSAGAPDWRAPDGRQPPLIRQTFRIDHVSREHAVPPTDGRDAQSASHGAATPSPLPRRTGHPAPGRAQPSRQR